MRQAAFLAALAVTGSVRTAARRVGMSRETAYRLRGKPGAESFAAAWNAALRRQAARGGDPKPARKVTPAEVPRRALGGLLKPLIYAGRHVATVWKPDDSALLRHLAQLRRAERPPGQRGAADASFAPASASTCDDNTASPPLQRRGLK